MNEYDEQRAARHDADDADDRRPTRSEAERDEAALFRLELRIPDDAIMTGPDSFLWAPPDPVDHHGAIPLGDDWVDVGMVDETPFHIPADRLKIHVDGELLTVHAGDAFFLPMCESVPAGQSSAVAFHVAGVTCSLCLDLVGHEEWLP